VKLTITSISCQGQRMRGAVPPLPNTPSWRGAQCIVERGTTVSSPVLYYSSCIIVV